MPCGHRWFRVSFNFCAEGQFAYRVLIGVSIPAGARSNPARGGLNPFLFSWKALRNEYLPWSHDLVFMDLRGGGMADNNTSTSGGMKKELTLFNFFTIGFGAIIGTGWVLLVGDWMVLGGGPIPAIIAFAIGAIFLVPIGMCFGELTAAIPISGGIIEYVDRTFGRKMGFLTGWMLLLGNAPLCPWEAIAISTLLTDRFAEFPALAWLRSVKLYTIMGADVYLWPTIISLGFAVLVIVLNFRGAGAAAKLSSFLTKALLAGMVLAMVISFATGSPSNALPVFSQVTDAAGGSATEATSTLGGIVAGLVMTPFFYAGFDTIPQQAEEASANLDWKKFGLVPAIALLASGVFYLICIYSFGTIIDWHEFVRSSVPALKVLERINIFFYIAMLIIHDTDPCPMNSSCFPRSMLAMTQGDASKVLKRD